MTKLISPRVIVTLEQPNGQLREYTVQTDNRDGVRWDLLRSRKNWPKGSDAPMLWMTVLAWSAMLRSGEAGIEADVEKFIERCLQVTSDKANEQEEAAGNEAGAVDPFPQGADTGS